IRDELDFHGGYAKDNHSFASSNGLLTLCCYCYNDDMSWTEGRICKHILFRASAYGISVQEKLIVFG
ncbi:hypothetical protein M514_28408, partial [Trichuris suis]